MADRRRGEFWQEVGARFETDHEHEQIAEARAAREREFLEAALALSGADEDRCRVCFVVLSPDHAEGEICWGCFSDLYGEAER